MAAHSPGPSNTAKTPPVLGKDPKQHCKDCSHLGHPSNYSVYCPKWFPRDVKDRDRDYENGTYWYRNFVWKCWFERFCTSVLVEGMLRHVIGITSRVRFEAMRFIQLFLMVVP